LLEGLAGNDSLSGGSGDDTLVGGEGVDSASYSGVSGDFRFGLNASGQVVVTDLNLTNGDEGTDVLDGIETIQFQDRSWFVDKWNAFRVNTYTTSGQILSRITTLSDGGFVVVWSSAHQDGSGWGVYGQRYSGSGELRGSEFRVNTFTTDTQWLPMVTALSEGGFVITWDSYTQDGSEYGVFGQCYTQEGAGSGSEFMVNTTLTNNQYGSTVASLPDGGFLVAWAGEGLGDNAGIFGRRFSGLGQPLGGEFRINSTLSNDQSWPAATSLPGGDSMVIWYSRRSDNDLDVMGQRFTSNGSPVGAEFRLNIEPVRDGFRPAIAALTDGGFVAAWGSSYINDLSSSGYAADIYARRYTATGIPLGSEFRVNTVRTVIQVQPAITGLSDGGFWLPGMTVIQEEFLPSAMRVRDCLKERNLKSV